MATRRKTASTEAPARPRYSAHPGLAGDQAAKDKLHAETGKTFDQWLALAKKQKLDGVRALRNWLHEEHGLRPMRAYWIASTALDDSPGSYDDPAPMVDALYSGRHASWRDLHETLIDRMFELGPDIVVTACKTMVPVYRKFVFAELRPVTTGVEVHLALGDAKVGKRLVKAPGRMAGDRLTRAVVVGSAADIDAEYLAWIAQAYAAGNATAKRSTAAPKPPPEFTKALAKSATARATWDSCTPAMRRDMLQWITEAKQEATRAKRLATAIAKLSEGKKRVY